jgi:hypothetical protein
MDESVRTKEDVTIRTVSYRISTEVLLYASRDRRKGVQFNPDFMEIVFVNGRLSRVTVRGQRITNRGNVHSSYRDGWNWPFQKSDKVDPATSLLDAEPPEFVTRALFELGYDPTNDTWDPTSGELWENTRQP